MSGGKATVLGNDSRPPTPFPLLPNKQSRCGARAEAQRERGHPDERQSMNTTRFNRLGWEVTEEDVSDSRERLQRYAQPPPQPALLPERKAFRWQHAYSLFLYLYFLGRTAELIDAAETAMAAADDKFFGNWRNISPSGNDRKQPPDPEYWHQRWGQDEDFVMASCIASCVGRWDFIARVAKYMSEIRWNKLRVEARPAMLYIELPDGREESAWRLILAGVIYDLKLDRELEPLVDIVLHGRCVRERTLFRWLEAVAEKQSDEQVQRLANEYFDYYLKHEVREESITAKVMIEGTLMVNYTRHCGKRLTVPDSIGERYIQVQPK